MAYQKKAPKGAFFNEINPCGFVKCAVAHEIRLRRMKCLRAWVDLFYFTFCVSKNFHNGRKTIISYCEAIFHLRRKNKTKVTK